MIVLEFLYSIAAIIALSACIPQIRQLVATKQSDEFSMGSWLLWTLTQIVTFMYVVAIGNVLMACVNAAWVSFYAWMTFLVIRYRILPVAPKTLEPEVVLPSGKSQP